MTSAGFPEHSRRINHPKRITVNDFIDAVIEGARRQRVKKAAVLASIASSTFERGWVNVQRDPDDEQLMSALPPATWRTT
ncbi:hypothetical protein [Paraburkholderia sp. CI3]|uniref:hypothetical protein n=1 Tax=Paraburkholderia sp. CI3 TaxID=2991060 RepID=UPI003D212F36